MPAGAHFKSPFRSLLALTATHSKGTYVIRQDEHRPPGLLCQIALAIGDHVVILEVAEPVEDSNGNRHHHHENNNNVYNNLQHLLSIL